MPVSLDLESPSCFFDLQYNGCWPEGGEGPLNLSSESLSPGDVITAMRESFRRGSIPCPTMITMERSRIFGNLKTIATALDELGIKGRWIHCEGPFFTGVEGARGAHPPEHVVKKADLDLLKGMIEASNDRIAVLTLGADVENVEELIRCATERNIIVSFCHHDPTYAQVKKAVEAGASMLTHYGNGVTSMVDRHGFHIRMLAFEGIKATVITDGVHLGPDGSLEKVFLKALGPDKFCIISDRSPLGGAPELKPDETYDLWGSRVHVSAGEELDGEANLIIKGVNGHFAGAYADMLKCMNHFAALAAKWREEGATHPYLQIGEKELWQMGTVNPLAFINKNPMDFASVADMVQEVHFEREINRFVV